MSTVRLVINLRLQNLSFRLSKKSKDEWMTWRMDDGWMYILPPVIHLRGASLLSWSSNTCVFCWRVTNETSADMKEKRHMVHSDQRVFFWHLWLSCSSSRHWIIGSSLPPRCLHACPGNRAPWCHGWCQRCVGWIHEILKPETSCRSCWVGKKTEPPKDQDLVSRTEKESQVTG